METKNAQVLLSKRAVSKNGVAPVTVGSAEEGHRLQWALGLVTCCAARHFSVVDLVQRDSP